MPGASGVCRQTGPPREIVIRRQHLLADAQAALGRMGSGIKCSLKVCLVLGALDSKCASLR